MYHIVKRVTKGGVINIDTTPHGRHGDGARYSFAAAGEGDDQYQLDTETVRAIMSDPGIAHHFEVDPPLPEPEAEPEPGTEPETERADNEEQPGSETRSALVEDSAPDVSDLTASEETRLDGSNETHTGEVGLASTETRRRPRNKP